MKAVRIAAAVFLLAASALAAEPRSYQATGSVVEIKGDVIVIQKGRDSWEIGVGGRLSPDVKVGSTVTVQYRMTATDVVVKDAKGGNQEATGSAGSRPAGK